MKETHITHDLEKSWDFDGWGTSLAWFANAFGDLGERKYSEDPELDRRARASGAALRQSIFDAVFGVDGLSLNMARFNIGGGNASDVGYGYPYTRMGAALPGYWRQDPDGSNNTYNGVTTSQRDQDRLLEAFDPFDDSHYDWTAGLSQEWWIREGVNSRRIDHWEMFANSAPWFMTESGYATGGMIGDRTNLISPDLFAAYLAHVVDHLEHEYGFTINTLDALNEPELDCWVTPPHTAADAADDPEHRELINRYANQYPRMNPKLTPYATTTHKPQEGMRVDPAMQSRVIVALRRALDAHGLHTVIAASDATRAEQFLESAHAWTRDAKQCIGQYNVHAYQHDGQEEASTLAEHDGRRLSMSEVDGSWVEGFDPYDFRNAIGIAKEIAHDVNTLASKDFTFWQAVEDLYNQQTERETTLDKDGQTTDHSHCDTLNPHGEDSNWGLLLADFDPWIVDDHGRLHSKRRVDNNNGVLDESTLCRLIASAKYAGMRAFTTVISSGDRIVANNDPEHTLIAVSPDLQRFALVHVNDTDESERLIIDIEPTFQKRVCNRMDAYVTTDIPKQDTAPTITEMNASRRPLSATSAVYQDNALHVSTPPMSITSITINMLKHDA